MNINKILIGIDESKYADHAAQYGFNLAKQLNASIGIVNIIEPVATAVTPMGDTAFTLPFTGTGDAVNLELMDTQNQAADTLMNRIVEKYADGTEVTQYTDYGSSADGIINCAAQFGASLIVVGTHHRSGFDRLLMGSVAEKVVRESTIPVLVIPMKEE